MRMRKEKLILGDMRYERDRIIDIRRKTFNGCIEAVSDKVKIEIEKEMTGKGLNFIVCVMIIIVIIPQSFRAMEASPKRTESAITTTTRLRIWKPFKQERQRIMKKKIQIKTMIY